MLAHILDEPAKGGRGDRLVALHHVADAVRKHTASDGVRGFRKKIIEGRFGCRAEARSRRIRESGRVL